MSNNNQTIQENREFYDSIGNIYPAVESVSISNETINNITCYWFKPENAKQKELVIYVHGGGYSIGSLQSHKAMVSHFANALERNILFIEYALAPEKPYPNGLNDVINIYEWATQKFSEYDFYLLGDSAGGGLIIASVYEIHQNKLKFPKGVALISPWYNLELNNISSENRQHLDQILNKEMLKYLALVYAGTDLSVADPSKLNYETFPPVFVGVGTNEILYDDSINFYDMVYKIQPNSQLKIYGGQGHVLTQMNISSPSSQDLINNLTNFFNNLNNE